MKRFYGLFLGFSATALWGSFYIVGRWLFGEDGGKDLNPYLISFIRFILASIALSPVLLASKNRRLVRTAFSVDWKKFILVAFIGIVLESYLTLYALNFTTSSRCSLMANCSPIMTVLLAYWILHEKMTLPKVSGMLVGFVGIVFTFFTNGGDMYAETGARSLIGDSMGLLSGVCWALFTVYGAGFSEKYGGPMCMFVCFILGAVIMIPILPFTAAASDFQHLTPRVWLGLVYTSVMTLAIANACWYAALRYLKPGELGAFGYISAAITFMLSTIVLKERFTLQFVCAIGLILAGVTLMMLRGPSEKKQVVS